MKLKIKKLHPDAIMPNYAHPGDAGLDLRSISKHKIKPGELFGISTGISMEIPKGYVGLIWDKSGLAIKYGLKMMGGVIDSGYRGDVIVGMINLSKKIYTIEKGDKVAQMLIQKVQTVTPVEVKILSDTHRGTKNLGSTGRK